MSCFLKQNRRKRFPKDKQCIQIQQGKGGGVVQHVAHHFPVISVLEFG